MSSLLDIESDFVDVVISFHALEHVDSPLLIMKNILRVLKPDGIIRIIVPCEHPLYKSARRWAPNYDRHLFTWTPLLIGNLALKAGYTDIKAYVEPSPSASRLSKIFPRKGPSRRFILIMQSIWRNRLNTVLDARKPSVGELNI